MKTLWLQMDAHYALILCFGGMKILYVFEVHVPGTPTRLEVHVTEQFETAMQNKCKWIRSQRESTLVCETGSNLKIAS